MNSVNLVGRLSVDPELRYTPGGKALCKFQVAVNRDYKDAGGQKVTDFIPVVCWGVTAENVAKYMSKGRMVSVQGNLYVDKYDKEDGSRGTSIKVNAKYVRFLDSKKEKGVEDISNNYHQDIGMEVVFDENDIPF